MANLTEPELQGQLAIVTGAGGGIGAAIARRLARMGRLLSFADAGARPSRAQPRPSSRRADRLKSPSAT